MASLGSFAVSFVSFLIVIGLCVLVHELGHFITAWLLGVQVHEFALGMGPALKQIRRTDKSGRYHTLWSLRAIPFGGFCRLAGMTSVGEGEDEDDDPVVPGMGFNEQPAWKRFFILFNGSVGNVLLAFVLTMAFLCGYGVPNMRDTRIGTLMDGFPAQKAGFQAGDRILEVNGTRVSEWREMSVKLREAAAEGDVIFTVERGDVTFNITASIPFSEAHGYPMLGITPALARYPIHEGLKNAVGYTKDLTIMMLRSIWGLIAGKQEVDVTGPVGIASMSGRAMRDGPWSFITFLALISLNLGLLNLLPFPALDGGRIIFVLLEMVLRRRLPEKVENWIHTAGFVLLISLMIFVTWKDIYNLFFVE
ncbi:MAG: RIP metalloprotease RseP [Synergistaceae bacterium]|nr:RIP metalloprotease RseP [Synergistaceae bacterium]